ncbi:disks large5-like, partial [Tropilaelaps mercedesae]
KLDGSENGGGFETCKSNDTLWVSRIEAGGPADGKLLLQDQIIKINGASVFQMGAEVAQEMLQKATDYLKLEVKRRASSQHKHSTRRGYFFCELQVPEKETHGLVLETGVYVAQTVPGTPGSQVLQSGDRIVSIDGQVVTDMQFALEKLDKPGRFQLQVCRFGSAIGRHDDIKDRSANTTPKKFSSACVQTDEKLAKTLASPSEKKASNTLLDRAKNKIFGEKKSTRPLSTIQSSNDPKEAIFELDSVIDRFSSERKSAKSHKGSTSSSSKENHRGGGGGVTGAIPNNGGTWPKYRGALAEHQLQASDKAVLNVNTLQPTHKRKERKSIPKQFYHSSSDSSPVSSGSSPIKTDAYALQSCSEILRDFNSLVQTAPSSRNHSQDRYYSMTTPRPHSKPLAVNGSSGLVTAQTSSMQVSARPRSAHYTVSALDGGYGSHYMAHSGGGGVKESAYEMILPASLGPSALNPLNPLNSLNPHGPLGAHGGVAHHGGHGGAHNPLYPNYYTTGASHSTRHAMSTAGHVGPVCCPPGPGPYMSRSGDSLLSAGAESSSTNTFTPPTGYGIKDSGHYSGGSYTPSPCPSSLAAYQSSYSHSPTYGLEFGHFHGAPYPAPHGPPAPPLHAADHGALGGTHTHVHAPHVGLMHAAGGVGGAGGTPTTADVGVSIAGLATFPKRQQRIRIPSTPSVSSSVGRVSTGSIDREHQHRPASPLQPALTVELINSSGGDIELNPKNRKPKAGDTRRIIIEKSKEPLGIQIKGGTGQSIFVSSVTENSLAEKAGLQIGDQLLEVCGINMRNATYQLAANVLRQCRDSMTMLVQFNPDKYREGCCTPGGASSNASESPSDTPHASPKSQYRPSPSGGTVSGGAPNGGAGGGSATKRHRSPGAAGANVRVDARDSRSRSNDDLSSGGGSSTLTRSSHKGGGGAGGVYLPTVLQPHSKMAAGGGTSGKRDAAIVGGAKGVRECSTKSAEPRLIVLNKPSSSNLGITLLGGNAVGIFVHSVEPDSPAAAGLRPGDQILEYNGIDLRNFTAEDAASELAKPTGESAQLKVLVQENVEKYMEIQEYGSGDAFYVRALFDRPATDGSLAIKKDDVFFIDNTMYKGVNGLWRAWLVDQEGRKSRCGFIPSRYKAEEELVLRRSLLDMAADEAGRRGSARRSFFRRRSKNASTREIAAYSDASINSSSYSADSAASVLAADDLLPPLTYQRVEKLCYTSFRPVILIGPLNDAVMEKLEQDYPEMFQRCLAEAMRGTPQLMEKGVSELKILDFQRRGSHFECTTISAIKAICEQSHAFLDVSLSLDVIIERLKKCQIYPIVIFIKFKSTKQIREVKDCRYLTEKMTTKAAKEMFEHSMKIESEYKHLINGVIQGNNLTYMCTQVKTCVKEQQNKTVWISTTSVQY